MIKAHSFHSPAAGACCNNTCSFIGISKTGNVLGSVPVGKTGGVASGGYLCGNGDDCNSNRYCVADALFKGQCPPADWVNDPLNQTLSIPATSSVPSCADNSHVAACYEFHKSSATLCDGSSAICSYDGCTKSICSLYHLTNQSGIVPNATFAAAHSAQSPVQCTDTSHDCTIGCQFQSGVCVATSVYKDTLHGLSMNVSTAFRAAGRSCNNFAGFCDGSGTCTGLTSDSAFNALANFNFGEWIKNNWIVIIGVVGGLILTAIVMNLTYRSQKKQINAVMRRFGDKLATAGKRATVKNDPKSGASKPAAAPTSAEQREQMIEKYRKIKTRKCRGAIIYSFDQEFTCCRGRSQATSQVLPDCRQR